MRSIINGVRELREETGLSQGQLAATVGVSRQSVNSIERGRTVPTLELALRLAIVLNCPVDEMFWLADDGPGGRSDAI